MGYPVLLHIHVHTHSYTHRHTHIHKNTFIFVWMNPFKHISQRNIFVPVTRIKSVSSFCHVYIIQIFLLCFSIFSIYFVNDTKCLKTDKDLPTPSILIPELATTWKLDLFYLVYMYMESPSFYLMVKSLYVARWLIFPHV